MSGEKKKSPKKIIIIAAAAVLVIGLGVTAFLLFKDNIFGSSENSDTKKSSTEQTYSEKAAAMSNENFVSFEEGFTDIKVTDQDSALKAVSAVADDIGIDNIETDLKVSSVNSFDGETYYRMQQYHNGVPVHGRDVVLVANDSGDVTSLSSNTVKIGNNVKAISADAAKNFDFSKIDKIIGAFLNNDSFKIEDVIGVSIPEAAYFVDINKEVKPSFIEHISLVDANKKKYNFKVVLNAETYEVITCSAETESVARRVSASGSDIDGDNRRFNVMEENGEYIMEDTGKNIKVYNLNGNSLSPDTAIIDSDGNVYSVDDGKLYDKNGNEVFLDDDEENIVDENGKVIGSDLKTDFILSATPNDDITDAKSNSPDWNNKTEVTVYSRVNNAYDLYNNVLYRSGFNGVNGKIIVCYNDYLDGDTTNAYSYTVSDATLLSFGSDNKASFDTVGHEFTHSVINSIVELDYNGESGALHEAYADIFGEIAEDYSDGTLDGNCNWKESEFRDIKNPASDGNPTVYKGDNWHLTFSVPDFLKDTPLSILDLFTDKGGVHSNCTVISHAAYMMNQGIDGNEKYKIGTELLAKIWHKSMFALHSDETFEQCANHVYDAATRTKGVSIYQLECIKKAFEMAGLKIETSVSASVRRGTVVNVVDSNGNKYANYHITINNSTSGDKVVDEDVKSRTGYTLNLDKGTYEMTITDNQVNSKNSFTKTLNVTDSSAAGRNPYINIFTDF